MSALDEFVKKDIRKYTPIEHAIFRVWMEGLESESPVIIDMARQSAEELSALRERVKTKDTALRLAEWGRMAPSGDWACPVCKMLENYGHADNCELAAALQAP